MCTQVRFCVWHANLLHTGTIRSAVVYHVSFCKDDKTQHMRWYSIYTQLKTRNSPINQMQKTDLNQYQIVPTDLNQYQTVPTDLNQYQIAYSLAKSDNYTMCWNWSRKHSYNATCKLRLHNNGMKGSITALQPIFKIKIRTSLDPIFLPELSVALVG